MAITRTPMIDDDGSGQTGTILNNAWKQELYGQIDALLGQHVGWSPSDASGAGLSWLSNARYAVTNQVLQWWIEITAFPSNASGANAVFGGLPTPVQFLHAGGQSTFGPSIHVHTPVQNSVMYLLKADGAAWTNQELSGRTIILQGSYLWS